MSDGKKYFKTHLLSTAGIILLLSALIMVNFVIARVNIRWDATQNEIYSLSAGTKQILSDLKEKVVIKVFYSQNTKNLPLHIKNFTSRVIDFLREYEYYSKGKIKIEIYDPIIDSEEEEWAQKYGISGMDLATGGRFYFGLTAMAADQEATINFIDPAKEKQLEYNITRVISDVQMADKKKILIISSLPVFGQPSSPYPMPGAPKGSPPWLFISELKKTYDVSQLPTGKTEIAKDTDLLIIIHPKKQDIKLLYAIDQFVLAGGRVLAFVDNFCVSDNPRDPAKSSSLEKLFGSWGVSMEEKKVLVDFAFATKLRAANNRVEQNPLWISARQPAFNNDDIITSQLESMLFPLAGAIKKTKDCPYTYEPLIQSSKNSAMIDVQMLNFGVEALRRDFKPTPEVFDLAIKLTGTFKSAFPDGFPREKKSNTSKPVTPPTALKQGTKEAVIIVVSDADLLFDAYYVSKQNFLGMNISNMFNDNLNFLLNTCELLTGSEALIQIRTRGIFERPFLKVQQLESKAQGRWLEQEQELSRQVEQTNRKLRELEREKDSSQKFIMSAQQEKEIKKFRDEKIRINKQLKKVRRNLRSEIETLGRYIKFINIFLIPIIICLGGLFFAVFRKIKRN